MGKTGEEPLGLSRCPQGIIICFVLLSLVAYPPPRTGLRFLFRTSGRQQFNPMGKYKADGVLETVRLSGNSTQPLAWFGDGPFPLQSQVYPPCPGVGLSRGGMAGCGTSKTSSWAPSGLLPILLPARFPGVLLLCLSLALGHCGAVGDVERA